MAVYTLPKEFHPDFSQPGRMPTGAVKLNNSSGYTENLVIAHLYNSKQNLVNHSIGTTQANAQLSGKGLLLDGTGDYFKFSAADRVNLTFGTEEFTIVIRFQYRTPTSISPTLIGNGDTAAGEFMIRASTNTLQFYGNSGAIIATTGTYTFVDGDYYTMIAIRQANGAIIVRLVDYVTGVTLASGFDNGATDDLSTTNATTGVGGADENSARWWQGVIESCFVWKGRSWDNPPEEIRKGIYTALLEPAVPISYFTAGAAPPVGFEPQWYRNRSAIIGAGMK